MGKLILAQLLENNRKWIKRKLDEDPDYFKKLSMGQSPKYLMIGCSDSRVPLNNLLEAPPGEIFIHRNVANQISLTDMNFLTVLEYSVEHLSIEYIIIMGHYACGGIAAAIDGVDQGLIENWIAPVKDLYIKNYDELNKFEDKNKLADKLAELNVIQQVKNVLKTAVMQRAFTKQKYPKILGWIFDIYTGKIIEMKLPIEKWKKHGLLPKFYEY